MNRGAKPSGNLAGAEHIIDNPCNGKGVCGSVKYASYTGEAGEVSSTELRFLKPEEVKKWCASFLYGSSTV